MCHQVDVEKWAKGLASDGRKIKSVNVYTLGDKIPASLFEGSPTTVRFLTPEFPRHKPRLVPTT